MLAFDTANNFSSTHCMNGVVNTETILPQQHLNAAAAISSSPMEIDRKRSSKAAGRVTLE